MRPLTHSINVATAFVTISGLVVYTIRSWDSHHHVLESFIVLVLVVIPYGVLFFTVRLASSLLTASVAFAVVAVCAGIAAVLYTPSFTITDPKYVLAIWLAFSCQLTVAGLGLTSVWFLRPKGPPSNMAVVADAPATALLEQAASSARRTPPR
jgi:hypothetical protein